EDRASPHAHDGVRRDHSRASGHLESARRHMRGWLSVPAARQVPRNFLNSWKSQALLESAGLVHAIVSVSIRIEWRRSMTGGARTYHFFEDSKRARGFDLIH